MTKWDAWKERNDTWWTPFVALPLFAAVVLAYTLFWLPYIAAGALWQRVTR